MSQHFAHKADDVTKGKGKGVSFRALPLPQILIALGLVLCIVPLVSDELARRVAREVITATSSSAASLNSDEYAEYLVQARAYNARRGGYTDPTVSIAADDIWPYEQQLLVDHTEVMASIEIPRANIYLPVYHGDDDETLAQGVGHLDESSLPVGGARSNCWLEGHSGLRSASLFDTIRVLEPGDVLALHVLNDTYAYRVTSWEIVGPDSVITLDIEDADQVTLVTCTTTPDQWNPKGRLGVNDKRLLVHATRCAYDKSEFETGAQEAAADPGVLVNEHNWQMFFAAAVLIGSGIITAIIKVVAWKRGGHDEVEGS